MASVDPESDKAASSLPTASVCASDRSPGNGGLVSAASPPASPPRSPLQRYMRSGLAESAASLGGGIADNDGELHRYRRELTELREQNARAKEQIWTATARLAAREQEMEAANLQRQRVGEARRVVADSPIRSSGGGHPVQNDGGSPAASPPDLSTIVSQQNVRLQHLEQQLAEARLREQELQAKLVEANALASSEAATCAVLRGELQAARAELEARRNSVQTSILNQTQLAAQPQQQPFQQSLQQTASFQPLQEQPQPSQQNSPTRSSVIHQQQTQQTQLPQSLQPTSQAQAPQQFQQSRTMQQTLPSSHLPQLPQTTSHHQPQVVIVTSSSLRSLDGKQDATSAGSPRLQPPRLRSAEVTSDLRRPVHSHQQPLLHASHLQQLPVQHKPLLSPCAPTSVVEPVKESATASSACQAQGVLRLFSGGGTLVSPRRVEHGLAANPVPGPGVGRPIMAQGMAPPQHSSQQAGATLSWRPLAQATTAVHR